MKSQLDRMPGEKEQNEVSEDYYQQNCESNFHQTFSDKRKTHDDNDTSLWILKELRKGFTEKGYEEQANIMENNIFNHLNEEKSWSDEEYTPLPFHFTPVSTAAINAPSSVKSALYSGGRPLEDFTRSFMEPRLGIDLSQIRVHDNDKADESAKALGAQAYTLGSDIVFAKGKYSPGTHSGIQLLAHELTHIMQQSQPAYPSSENHIQRKAAVPPALQTDTDKLVKPEVSPEELNEMKDDVGTIVSYLKDGLNDNRKMDILYKIRKWHTKDLEIKEKTGYSGTVYLDKFLSQLKSTSFTISSIRTLWIEEYLLVFDSLFYELDGEYLESYIRFISLSETQKEKGPISQRMDNAWSYLGKQELMGLWGMTKGLGMGLAGMADSVGYVVSKPLKLAGVDIPELTSAKKLIGEKFDESGKIMFGDDYNKEKLFWGLGAADIGEIGGTVIWNIAMMGKGKTDASSKAFRGFQGATEILSNIKDIEDSVSKITEIIGNMPQPIEIKKLVSDPNFMNEITSLAVKSIGMASSSTKFAQVRDKFKSVADWMEIGIGSAQTATLIAKIFEIISNGPEGEQVEELKGALISLFTSMANVADKSNEKYKERKRKKVTAGVEAEPEGTKAKDASGKERGKVVRRSDIGDEAHNVANYEKYKQSLREAEAAKPSADSKKQAGDLSSKSLEGTAKTPSSNTKVINTPEVKASKAIKSSDAVKSWDDYLGPNQTDINPRTGQKDPDRIFSADGTRSIRFGNHEMKSLGTPKGHYHMETWTYDPVNDSMTVTNTLQRIKE